MKTVILFRHGKANLDKDFSSDHNKTLTPHGIKGAKKMGQYLSQNNEIPDLVISSTAIRAKSTAKLALKTGKWTCPLSFNEIIYTGSTNDLLTIIQEQDDAFNSICIVGHEPKFSNFINHSTNNEQTKFPTGSMAKINFDILKWKFTEFKFSNLDWLISPKELNEKGE